MAVHRSTAALKTELKAPSVLSFADFRSASRLRQTIGKVSGQAHALQQLVVDVDIDETNAVVRAKMVGLRATLRSMQHQHDRCEKEYNTLSQLMGECEAEWADIVDAIRLNE